MPKLNSSCLAWVEFDSGTMYLRFHKGRSYTLRRLPERQHYHGLLTASSPGWYWNVCLKGDQYDA